MPEPMTPPTTIMTVVKSPRAGRRLGEDFEVLGIRKFQIPTSKLQRSSRLQIPRTNDE
jgi:hypothetical protein